MQSLFKSLCLCIVIFSSSVYASVLTVPQVYPTIQSAINAAVPNDTIIVSPGTYVENINFNGKDIILTSTDPEDPDIMDATIIDGNAAGSVVTFSGTETPACELRGFTIKNGRAQNGAGITGNQTQVTIENCQIISNNAYYQYGHGGGLYNCDGVIRNCTISFNTIGQYDCYGAGLYGCDGVIENCLISYNQSGWYSRGCGLAKCNATIANCKITNNSGGDSGAGLYGCHGTITNCQITNNSANSEGSRGGGMLACGGVISNCVIANNIAHTGGGLYGCNNIIKNCIITGNRAYLGGGGGLSRCDAIITNCTIIENTAHVYGGGLYNGDGIIVNCIIWGNHADNLGDQLYDYSTPTYSCIENWYGGEGNINEDPMCSIDPNNWELSLFPGSPCIDTGTNSPPGGLPSMDINGFPRPFDGDLDSIAVADMGAYEFHEFPNEPCLHVTPKSFSYTNPFSNPPQQTITITNVGKQVCNWHMNLSNKPDWLTIGLDNGVLEYGESCSVTFLLDITELDEGAYSYEFGLIAPTALNSLQIISINLRIGGLYVPGNYTTIQEAINASTDGDTIVIWPGTYVENINFNGKDIVLRSTNPEDPDIVASTIIDGNANGSVVTFSGTETSACELRGFTITNGIYNNGDWWHGGGGICGNGTDASIYNCTITNNKAEGFGGGLWDCDGLIFDCIISNNYVYYLLGLEDSYSLGGGLNGCDGTITNCIIVDNSVDDSNYSWGGGLYDCNGMIINCTVAGNEANFGGGLTGCNGTIRNCIICNNLAYNYDNLSSCSNPSYSKIGGDPLFADSGNGDYHLKSEYGRWNPDSQEWVYDDVTSPCIDGGDPSAVEWQNELWSHGKQINMGAYGGTPQASMSSNPVGNVADLDHDDEVSLIDLMLFSKDWLSQEYLLDTDLNRNGAVDIADFAEFGKQWLWTEP